MFQIHVKIIYNFNIIIASIKFRRGRWEPEEHERFLKACYDFKNDWEKIEKFIKTRSIPQIHKLTSRRDTLALLRSLEL